MSRYNPSQEASGRAGKEHRANRHRGLPRGVMRELKATNHIAARKNVFLRGPQVLVDLNPPFGVRHAATLKVKTADRRAPTHGDDQCVASTSSFRSVTSTTLPRRWTPSTRAPTRNSTASCSSTRRRTEEASGSATLSGRSPRSKTVTADPKRAKACVNSMPTGTLPTTSKCWGRCSCCQTDSYVQCGVAASPGTVGGAAPPPLPAKILSAPVPPCPPPTTL